MWYLYEREEKGLVRLEGKEYVVQDGDIILFRFTCRKPEKGRGSMNMNINFPHLGIELEHVGRSISILGFHITYYGILIGLALVAGIFITIYFAVKSRQNIEHYLDLVIGTVLLGVLSGQDSIMFCFRGTGIKDISFVFSI